jgi:hypothetical protein
MTGWAFIRRSGEEPAPAEEVAMSEEVRRFRFFHLALAFITGALTAAAAALLSAPRTPNGLPSVAKSPICFASLRRSSVTYSRYAPSSLLALLASRRFRSVRQPDRRSRSGRESRAYLRRAARRGRDFVAGAPDAIRRGLRRGRREPKGYVGEIADKPI